LPGFYLCRLCDKMKQTKINSCAACVMAEIVGESEQYVLDWFKYYDPPFCDEDAILFLAHHGVYLSLYCKMSEPTRMDSDEDITVALTFKKRAFYIIVKSERFEDKFHAIFWNGYKVIDSNPDSFDGRDLSEYEIVGFYPVMRTEEKAKLFEELLTG